MHDSCPCICPVPPLPQLWGLERGYCLRTLMCHSSCQSLALSADGAQLASGHFDGALRFWDVRSGRLAHEVAGLHSQQITSVALGLRCVLACLPACVQCLNAVCMHACMHAVCVCLCV